MEEKIQAEVLTQTVVTRDGKKSIKTEFKPISMTPAATEQTEEELVASLNSNKGECSRLEREILLMTAKRDKLTAVIAIQEENLAILRK